MLSEFLQLFVLGARVSRSRVFLDGFHGGLCQEFIQVLAVGEDGVVVNVVYVFVVVALAKALNADELPSFYLTINGVVVNVVYV